MSIWELNLLPAVLPLVREGLADLQKGEDKTSHPAASSPAGDAAVVEGSSSGNAVQRQPGEVAVVMAVLKELVDLEDAERELKDAEKAVAREGRLHSNRKSEEDDYAWWPEDDDDGTGNREAEERDHEKEFLEARAGIFSSPEAEEQPVSLALECNALTGEAMGFGSAGLFGGHGYHPLSA